MRILRSGLARLSREEKGSLTLEAAVLMPIFLAFIVALGGWIVSAQTEVAVQAAASETVKQVAHHYTPIEQIRKGVYKAGEDKLKSVWDGMPGSLADGLKSLGHLAEEHVAASVMQPVVRYYAPSGLDLERLTVERVELPVTGNREKATLSIEVAYEWRFPVPFFEVKRTIRKKAVERVWR